MGSADISSSPDEKAIGGVWLNDAQADIHRKDAELERGKISNWRGANEIMPEGLEPYLKVWANKQEELVKHGLFDKLKQRLLREWAVEVVLAEPHLQLSADIIEMFASIDDDGTDFPMSIEAFIDDGIKELIRIHVNFISDLWDLAVKGESLSIMHIQEMHRRLIATNETKNATAFELGELRKTETLPYRPGVGFRSDEQDIFEKLRTPAEKVPSALEELVKYCNKQDEDEPELKAAKVHHRFLRILPFPARNECVARMLTMYVLLKHGRVPFVVGSKFWHWREYSKAFLDADRQAPQLLATFLRKLEKSALGHWFSEGERLTAMHDKLASGTSVAVRRYGYGKHGNSLAMAETLRGIAVEVFDSIKEVAGKEIQKTGSDAVVKVDVSDSEKRRKWFGRQITGIAQGRGYFANLDYYASWVQLKIERDTEIYELVVSLHPMGEKFDGTMAAIAFCQWRMRGGKKPVSDHKMLNESHRTRRIEYNTPYPLVGEPFKFAEKDITCQLRSDFQEWLGNLLRLFLWRSEGPPLKEEEYEEQAKLAFLLQDGQCAQVQQFLREWLKDDQGSGDRKHNPSTE